VPATADDLLARTARRGLTAVTLTELAGAG
jgi:hypothetical protein